MRDVWKFSPAKGSELLLLLAIADNANHHRIAWPGIDHLAGKTRLSRRQTQNLIRQLESDGLIKVHRGAGPNGVHLYEVVDPESTLKKGGEKISPGKDFRVKPSTQGGEIQRHRGEAQYQKGVKPTSPKPSYEPPIEPPVEPLTTQGSSFEKKMPRTGYAQILLATLYEDVLKIGSPTNYGQAVAQAQTLAEAGCTPEELTQIAEWLLSQPFWQQRGISIATILKERDAWRAAGKATAGGRAARGTRHKHPGPDDERRNWTPEQWTQLPEETKS